MLAAGCQAQVRAGVGFSGSVLRLDVSGLSTQASSRARPLTRGPKAIQTLDQHRVGLEGSRVVDQGVEHLVVPRGAHVEELANGLLLGASVLPPLTLEGDDLTVAVAQLAQRCGLDLCRDVLLCGGHITLRVAGVQVNRTGQMTPLSFTVAV